MMTKEKYLEIRDSLDFKPNPLISFAMIAIDLALFALGIFLLEKGTLAFIFSQFLFAIVFFRGFTLLHECGHGAAFTSNRLNNIVGHFSSLFSFLPYFPWKYIHNEHHTWSGNIDKDPVLELLRVGTEAKKNPTAISKIKFKFINFFWKSWIPLLGLMQLFVFWTYPIKLIKSSKITKRQLKRTSFSVLFLFVSYATLYYAFPHIFNIGNFGIAFIIYLFVIELVNFPHHTGMEVINNESDRDKLRPYEQHITTRSCYYPKFISEFFVYNFNFHTEHHFFPKLPWYKLRKARDAVKNSLANDYNEEVGIKWNIINRKNNVQESFLNYKIIK